jgi:hypothetical protein
MYSRVQRLSIEDPATIGDIPQEVLRKAFLLLVDGRDDYLSVLASLLSICRAWRPVAQEIVLSWVRFNVFGASERFVEYRDRLDRFACGFQLNLIAFGSCYFPINKLTLELSFISRDRVEMITRLVSTTLTSLELRKSHQLFIDIFDMFEVIFANGHGIRRLKLENCDFGLFFQIWLIHNSVDF